MVVFMKEVRSEKILKSPNPLSQGIRHGDLIFLSGQIARNPETGKLEEGFENQTRRILDNIVLILESEGVSMEQVIKVNIFLIDMGNMSVFNAIYSEYFDKAPYPARTCVQVSLGAGIEVEIEVIASTNPNEHR